MLLIEWNLNWLLLADDTVTIERRRRIIVTKDLLIKQQSVLRWLGHIERVEVGEEDNGIKCVRLRERP